ncbi:hypothetical protein [uncultured Microbacterium sp.]|uniref:hypothetical protein n=1 Tax=uncultured Microbacterium sp. TaxID=191216 RepID=UPI0026009A94|nr:hypothetical protein [uncultured Microbacterium sp.]
MLTPSLPTEAPTGLPLSARRRIQAGMVVATAAGVPRTGVLSASVGPLVTGTTDPTMTYRIAPFVGASSRDSIGVEFVANDASDVAQSAVAPSANSRIDVIWFRSPFPSLTDPSGQNSPVFGVTRGTPDANPQKPTNVPPGAEELATAVVTSSDLTTQTVVITNTFRWTAMAGGVVSLRSQAEMTAWTPANGAKAFRLDLGVEFTRVAGSWVPSSNVGVVTDGNVVAGAWDPQKPIRRVFLSGSPQVDAASVTTLSLPGGGFSAFVLRPQITLMSAGVAKQAVVSEISLTQIKIQILNKTGDAIPQGTAVPLAVELIGG